MASAIAPRANRAIREFAIIDKSPMMNVQGVFEGWLKTSMQIICSHPQGQHFFPNISEVFR
jgi:hypothetical protein